MVLAVEHLTVRYRTPTGVITALDDVGFTIPRGAALGLVGESGSGKSTVALAVMGLLPGEARVEAGRIALHGADMLAMATAARRALRGPKLAMVFQDPFASLNPSLRIGDQIGEGLVHHRAMSREAALDAARGLLAEVGIADPASIARAYPHLLSGGMRQRALIASALACEPELLVLDEPTTALDVTIEAQILDLLDALRAKRGLSLLFISHNLGVVRRLCDSLAVIYAGRIVEHGPTASIFAAPDHPYTKGLLAAIPRIGAHRTRLAAIPGRLPDLSEPEPGCNFAPRCPFVEDACADAVAMQSDATRSVRCRRGAALRGLAWPASGDAITQLRVTPAGKAMLEVRDLTKRFTLSRGLAAWRLEHGRLAYRPKHMIAVDRVDLDVRAGEVLGLVGESGCGKTTLGRTILRLIEPDAGSVRIDGRNVTGASPSELLATRRVAQIVFQNPDSALNPRKTVGELIARPLRRFAIVPRREIDARVASLLDLVNLPASYATRFAHQMSGGEKQRVGIARALATEPKFLVCDEPVSALDVSVQANIVNLLAGLRDRLGVAFVFISHDIAVVAHLADRIAVMYRGRIVEIGPAAEVLAPPFHPYTEALLSAVPRIDQPQAGRIPLRGEVTRSDESAGCVFAARCPRSLGALCDSTPPPARDISVSHRITCHLPLTS